MSHDFIPTFNASEQEDSEIQDITSFYLTDREVKEEDSENPFNRELLMSEPTDGCGEQEDIDLYSLYGEDEEDSSSPENSECSDDGSSASLHHYTRSASAPHIARRPARMRARQVQEDKRFKSALGSSQRSSTVKQDLPEERRGRSRAVPMKLVRWSDSIRHNLMNKEDDKDKLQQQSRKEAPSEC